MIIVYFGICFLVNFGLYVFAGGDAEIAAKRQATEGKVSYSFTTSINRKRN